MTSIKEIYQGNADREFLLKKWIPISGIIFWGCIILSMLIYPPEDVFSIFTHSISFLGDWFDNPLPGWLFFSFAMFCAGVTFFPIGMYFIRRFRVICNKTAIFCNFLYILGCIGVIFVGIFSDVGSVKLGGIKVSEYHNAVSVMGFGGVGLAILFYGFFPLRDKFKEKAKRYFTNNLTVIPNLVLLVALMGMAISQLMRLILGYDDFPGPGFYSFTFWEWALLFGIWIYHPLMVLVLPQKTVIG